MNDDEYRSEAHRLVPETWRVDDLAQVMRAQTGEGAWVNVWMWVEESSDGDN